MILKGFTYSDDFHEEIEEKKSEFDEKLLIIAEIEKAKDYIEDKNDPNNSLIVDLVNEYKDMLDDVILDDTYVQQINDIKQEFDNKLDIIGVIDEAKEYISDKDVDDHDRKNELVKEYLDKLDDVILDDTYYQQIDDIKEEFDNKLTRINDLDEAKKYVDDKNDPNNPLIKKLVSEYLEKLDDVVLDDNYLTDITNLKDEFDHKLIIINAIDQAKEYIIEKDKGNDKKYNDLVNKYIDKLDEVVLDDTYPDVIKNLKDEFDDIYKRLNKIDEFIEYFKSKDEEDNKRINDLVEHYITLVNEIVPDSDYETDLDEAKESFDDELQRIRYLEEIIEYITQKNTDDDNIKELVSSKIKEANEVILDSDYKTNLDEIKDDFDSKYSYINELKELINYLNSKDNNDIELIHSLVGESIIKANQIEYSTTFHNVIEAFKNEFDTKFDVVNNILVYLQKLHNEYDYLIKTNEYSTGNKTNLDGFYSEGKDNILSATSNTMVLAAYDQAVINLREVKVMHAESDVTEVTDGAYNENYDPLVDGFFAKVEANDLKGNVIINVTESDIDREELTKRLKVSPNNDVGRLIKKSEIIDVLDLTLLVNGEKPANGKEFNITVLLTPDQAKNKKIDVICQDDNGNNNVCQTTRNGNYLTFTTANLNNAILTVRKNDNRIVGIVIKSVTGVLAAFVAGMLIFVIIRNKKENDEEYNEANKED